MTSISASLIVKNEERFLRSCLASLAGHVDEVIIVDTGSTDDTVSIARDSGARLLTFPWNGSFSDARNAALDACTGDWILYIDADECLRIDEGLSLRSQLAVNDWAGAMVRFRPKSGYTRYWEHRLFRRDPSIRFEGKIHESHVRSVTDFASRHGLLIGRAGVSLDHYGYDGDQSHKHPRNLPLLQESIETTPSRIYYWYHLAETLSELGRPLQALETGERGLRIAASAASEKHAADTNLLAQTVARLRMEMGQVPSDVIEDALQRFPQDHAMAFLKARWLVNSGSPRAALPILDRLLAIDPDNMEPGMMAFDERIFGSLAIELKAAALVRLGDVAAAGMLLRRAAAGARPNVS